MANPITRPMLTVEQPSVDLLNAMETGKIVIIPMPHRNLGGLGPLVGMLILQSVVAAAYARPGDAMSRETAPVFIDEVQVFVVNEESPDLEQAFTQLRGFGVPMIVMHQHLHQLGKLESTFTINAANRLILRTGEPDASTYAGMYSQVGLRPEDIKGMEALNHQYAVTLGPAREQLVFSLRPNDWPEPVAHRMPLFLGAAWRTVLPAMGEDWTDAERAFSQWLATTLSRLVYGKLSEADYDRITGQLAQMPESDWRIVLRQWELVREAHYHYLLAHPEAEPEHLTRQAWLSNLASSRGALFEEALTLRQELRMAQAVATSPPASSPVAGATLVPPPIPVQPRKDSAGLPPPVIQPGISAEESFSGRGLRPEEKPVVDDRLREEQPKRARKELGDV